MTLLLFSLIQLHFSHLGKLKEWTLVLYGTSEHPYHSHNSQHSRSRMLEVPSPGRDLKGPEVLQDIVEEEEDEEEYNGRPPPVPRRCFHLRL